MHPVLLRIPLPAWSIPLSVALLVVAVVGGAVALFGWRAKAVDLLSVGICVALGGGAGAVAFRGDVYTLSELPLSSYGVTLCLALVAGWYMLVRLAKRDGLPRETTANCFVVAAISGFICARLLYALVNLDEFASVADVLNVRRGGLVAYGGFLGGLVGAVAFMRVRRSSFLPWADAAAPSLALGIAITRVGSYLLGSAYGTPLAEGAPGWLKRLGTFPHWPDDTLEGAGAPAWAEHVTRGLVPFDTAASLPVHPTQLYESVVGLLLLGMLFAIRQRQRFRGEVFLAFAFGYGLLRFLIEVVRGDPQRGLFGPHVAEHQYVPLVLLMFAAAYVFGPSRSLGRLAVRRATQALFVLPAVVVFIALRPAAFALPNPIQLSTSQWLGVLSAIAAAAAWGVLAKAAESNPDAAMSLHLGSREVQEEESDVAASTDSDTEPERDSDAEPPPSETSRSSSKPGSRRKKQGKGS